MSVPFTAEQIEEMIMVKMRMLRAELDTEKAQAADAAQAAATQAASELRGMFDQTKVYVEEMKASHQSQLDFVKGTNEKQEKFVNEKHEQVTALYGEVNQVKTESGELVARLRIRDDALRGLDGHQGVRYCQILRLASRGHGEDCRRRAHGVCQAPIAAVLQRNARSKPRRWRRQGQRQGQRYEAYRYERL